MKLFIAAALVGLILILGCTTTAPPPPESGGFVEGKVSIGPLCPVEPCSNEPDYKALFGKRKVLFYDFATKEKLGEANLTLQGDYRARVATGYTMVSSRKIMVDVTDAEGKELGLESQRGPGEAVPQEAAIVPGTTTILNFDIDTGIR